MVFAPQLFLPVYLPLNVGPRSPQAITSPALPTAALPRVLSARLPISVPPTGLHECSLTPWLSDFHTVRFSVSSGCFLFLSLSLSFFWLCKEAQCVYLHLHLGRKLVYLDFISFPTNMLSLLQDPI